MHVSLPPDNLPDHVVARLRPLYRALSAYHRYDVRGLAHLPRRGPALIVFTHSLATYDIFLFGARVYEERSRLINALVDRLIFKIPVLRGVAEAVGAVVGEPRIGRALLDAGRLVGVAPGGMREALRSSDARYRIDWQSRFGFAKLALETRAPVLLAACPRADDLYTVYPSALTREIYRVLKIPLPVARGVGLSALPRPVQLTHFLSEPIWPPRPAAPHVTHAEVKAFHALLVEHMQALIARARSE